MYGPKENVELKLLSSTEAWINISLVQEKIKARKHNIPAQNQPGDQTRAHCNPQSRILGKQETTSSLSEKPNNTWIITKKKKIRYEIFIEGVNKWHTWSRRRTKFRFLYLWVRWSREVGYVKNQNSKNMKLYAHWFSFDEGKWSKGVSNITESQSVHVQVCTTGDIYRNFLVVTLVIGGCQMPFYIYGCIGKWSFVSGVRTYTVVEINP